MYSGYSIIKIFFSICSLSLILTSCAFPPKIGEEIGVVDYNKVIRALYCEVIDAWEFDRLKTINNSRTRTKPYSKDEIDGTPIWKSAKQPVWKVTTTIEHKKSGNGEIKPSWNYAKNIQNWTKQKSASLSIHKDSYYQSTSGITVTFPSVYSEPGNAADDNFDAFRDNCRGINDHYVNVSALLISDHFIKFLKGYNDTDSSVVPSLTKSSTALLTNLEYEEISYISGSVDPSYTYTLAPITKLISFELSGQNQALIRILVNRNDYTPPQKLTLKRYDKLNNIDLAQQIAKQISRNLYSKKSSVDRQSNPRKTPLVPDNPLIQSYPTDKSAVRTRPDIRSRERLEEEITKETLRRLPVQ